MMTPFWGLVNVIGFNRSEVGIFVTFGQFLSLVPGVIGAFSRRAYYVMTLEDCAKDVGVGFGTWFSKRCVRIAPRVSFGAHCLIGSCSIGEGALFGSNIDVLSGRHQHVIDDTSELRAMHASQFSRVHIGGNTWIGNRAVIMADIGDNSVVGAGSVVVHNLPANVVAAGNPAVVKRILNDHCESISATKDLSTTIPSSCDTLLESLINRSR